MNLIDRIVSFVDPHAGLKRMYAREILERGYDAASFGKRTTGWKSDGYDANVDASQSWQTIVNRSRRLFNDDGYYKRSVKAIADDVVGTGIIARIKNTEIKKKWLEWVEKDVCDYDGHDNFYGIQKLVMKTVLLSGEVIVLRRQSKVGMQLQVLEPDYIDRLRDGEVLPNGGYIRLGVEFSNKDKIVAYWLYPEHPGAATIFNTTASERFPVDRVLHIYVRERPGQIRGVPNNVSSFIRLRDIADFEDAEVKRKMIASSYAAFIHDSADVVVTGDPNKDILPTRMSPGTIEKLPPGKQITFSSPPTVDGFDEYMRTSLRKVAVGAGMTYESLSGDYSQSNYSSSRMARNEYHKVVFDFQWLLLIPSFCDCVYDWFLRYHVVAVAEKCEWTPPALPFVDPVKEVQAIEMRVRAGLMSYQEAVREQGYEPEAVLEEIAEFNKLAKKLKVILTTMPEFFQQAGAQPQKKGQEVGGDVKKQ